MKKNTYPIYTRKRNANVAEGDWQEDTKWKPYLWNFPLTIKLLCLGLGPLFLRQKLHPPCSFSIWVEFKQSTKVLQWVLLQYPSLYLLFHWPDNTLNFIRVDDSSQIRVTHDGSGKGVVLLHKWLFIIVAKDKIQFLKCRFCPYNETAKMTTW